MPGIDSFSVESGPNNLDDRTGYPGRSLTLTGVGLDQVTTATVGGVSATITGSTPTTLTVTVPVAAPTGPVMVAGPGGSAEGPYDYKAALFWDTFHDADSTALTAHVPDYTSDGNHWANLVGAISIQSNAAKVTAVNGTIGAGASSIDLGNGGNGIISWLATPLSFGFPWATWRQSGAFGVGSFAYGGYNAPTSFYVEEYVGAAGSVKCNNVATPFPDFTGIQVPCSIVLIGQSVCMLLDGRYAMSWSDSFNNTEVLHGLAGGVNQTFANFEFDDLTGYGLQVTYEGDSIVWGNQASGPLADPYPAIVRASLPKDTLTLNFSWPGSSWVGTGSGQTLYQSSVQTRATFVNAALSPATLKVLFLATGHNDQPSTSAPDWLTALAAYVAAARSAGWDKIVVATILPSGVAASAFNTWRNLVNPGIRAMAGIDAVCDFDTDPRIGADAASSDLTYYNSDQTHPNQTGADLLAPIAAAAILSVI